MKDQTNGRLSERIIFAVGIGLYDNFTAVYNPVSQTGIKWQECSLLKDSKFCAGLFENFDKFIIYR